MVASRRPSGWPANAIAIGSVRTSAVVPPPDCATIEVAAYESAPADTRRRTSAVAVSRPSGFVPYHETYALRASSGSKPPRAIIESASRNAICVPGAPCPGPRPSSAPSVLSAFTRGISGATLPGAEQRLDLRDRLLGRAELHGGHSDLASGVAVQLEVVDEDAVRRPHTVAQPLHRQVVDRRVGLAHPH